MEDKKKTKKISRLKKQQKLFDFLSEHLITIKSISFISISIALICLNLIKGSISPLGWGVGSVFLIDYIFENVTCYGTDLCFDISEKIMESIKKIEGVNKSIEKVCFDDKFQGANLRKGEQNQNFYKNNKTYGVHKEQDEIEKQ